MDDITKYFEILGLKPEASLEEVKEAYRDLVKVWHPDRFAHDPKLQAKAQEKLKEINEAYQKIQDFLINLQHYWQATGPRKEEYRNTTEEKQQPSQAQEERQYYHSSQEPQANPATEDERNIQNLYEAALGEKNLPYYLHKFKQFDRQGPGLSASWNWSAFFFAGVWTLYRKMYGWFFALWGITTLSTIFGKTGSPTWSTLVLLGPWIAFTIFANSLYHRNIKKKIVFAQLNIKDELKLFIYLRRKGGIHVWAIWAFVLFFVIGVLAASIIPVVSNVNRMSGKQVTDTSPEVRKKADIWRNNAEGLERSSPTGETLSTLPSMEEKSGWQGLLTDAEGEHHYVVEKKPDQSGEVISAWDRLTYSREGRNSYMLKRRKGGMFTAGMDTLRYRYILFDLECASQPRRYAVMKVFEVAESGKTLDYGKAGSKKDWEDIPEGTIVDRLAKISCP